MTPAHRLSIACLAVLSSAWAQAQPARLTELMELAVQKHPTVLQARSQAQAAGFELEAAEWGRYPSVTSDIRSDSSATQSVLKVEQPLWAGGRIDARIALSQAGVRVAQSAVLEAQATALVQTSGSYLEILRLSDRDRIAADNLEALQRLVDLMSRRTQAQISASVDLTLAQARLQQATSERLQIQRQLESTRTALTEWVGPIPARLAQTRAIDHPTLRDTASRCGQLFDQALEFSAQRKRLLAQMDTANAQIELLLLAHIAGDTEMQAAFRSGEDFHTVTASRVFHVPPELFASTSSWAGSTGVVRRTMRSSSTGTARRRRARAASTTTLRAIANSQVRSLARCRR